MTHVLLLFALRRVTLSALLSPAGISMTLLDSLDTLALLSSPSAFAAAVNLCISRQNFSVDLNVCVL